MATSTSPVHASHSSSMTSEGVDLRRLAIETVERAVSAGAADAEVVIGAGDEFEALVRMGEVERLKESGSCAIGIRVYFQAEDGMRTATTSSTDFTEDGIRQLVSGAVDLAKITTPDSFAGLPATDAFGSLPGDLGLYHDDVYALPPAERIAMARRAEAAALTHEPAHGGSIGNSKGGGFDAATGHKILANSRGFVGEYRRSYCSIDVAPIAQTPDGKMQQGFWYSSARSAGRLESPESVGREAARRALRRLGAKPVPTQQVPIVFSPEIARSILGHIFEAASGSAIYHHSSFFVGMLGRQVAAENVTVIDDGTIVGGFGTAPFDGEGLPTRRNVIVENGILKSYLLNTYMARKLGMESTGSASRGLAGTPGIGAHNLFMTPGSLSPEALLSDVKAGLYVTELIGQGVNMVTGDYSRGASGLWIENGELTTPVEEITIAGNLKQMLMNITAIADDLVFRGSAAAPTLRIDGMVVAGD